MMSIIFTNLIQMIIIIYISEKIFVVKRSKIIIFITVVISTMILSLFNYFGPNIYGSLVFLILIMIEIVFLTNSSIIESMLTSILQFINISVAEFIAMFFFQLFFGLSENTDNTSIQYFFALLTSLLLTFMMSFMIIKFFEIKKKYKEIRLAQLLLILPIITLLLILNINDYFLMVRNYPIILFVLIGLMTSNFIMLYLFFRNIKAIQLESELKIIQSKMKLSKDHIDLLNEQYENNFNYLHNLLHEIHSINKSYKIKELEVMAEKLDLHFNSMLTNSLPLNTAINKLMGLIDENNIKIRTTIYDAFAMIPFENQVIFFESLLKIGIDNCINCMEKERILILQIKKINTLLALRFVTPNHGYRINENIFDCLQIEKRLVDFSENIDEELSIITYTFLIHDI